MFVFAIVSFLFFSEYQLAVDIVQGQNLQTPQQLEERKEKGLCFNCDSKYSKRHKCGEKKLFYIDCEEEEEQEQEPSQDENVEAISFEELTPTISCNALAGINTPQTLKIEGYIKNKKGNSPN